MSLLRKKGRKKIAVEIKTFRGASEVHDLELALGQYVLYRTLLKRFESDRKLYLAIPDSVCNTFFDEPIVRPVLEEEDLHIIAFDPQEEEVIQWRS